MKTPLPSLFRLSRTSFLGAAIATVLVASSCSKHDQTEVKSAVKDAYAETKAAAIGAWDSVKSFSFENRDKFSANAKALAAKADAQISEVRANYTDAKASESRKAAMAELKDSEADYKTKVDALGHATEATWDSAKANTIAAWDRLQAAYYKARAE